MNLRLVALTDGRNYSDKIIASAHGEGPVGVSVFKDPYLMDHILIENSKELGGRYAFNPGLVLETSWAPCGLRDRLQVGGRTVQRLRTYIH